MVGAFWQEKGLEQMSQTEWESLCDGCGKCCLVKFQDEDSGEMLYTNVACRYLGDDCRCSVYSQRFRHQADCVNLTPESVQRDFQWLPGSCAYRLVAEGKPLPAWHPLLAGSHLQMHAGDHSVRHKVFSEDDVHEDDLHECIVHWVDNQMAE